MKPVTVVYILSLGHSGSTLLDNLLGNHSRLESVGELIDLKQQLQAVSPRNGFCSCGRKYQQCSYWQEIVRRYQRNNIPDENNPDAVPDFRRSSDGVNLGAKVKAYRKGVLPCGVETAGDNYFRLARAILDYTKKDILVDSSKNPFFLYILKNNKGIDLRVIHLFRDIRGNVASWKRRVLSKNKRVAQRKRTYNFWKCYLALVKAHLHNKYISRLFSGRGLMSVRYERLCYHPEETMRDIFEFLGVDWERSLLTESDGVYYTVNAGHNLGGNPARLKSRQRISCSSDWKEQLSRGEKILFEVLGGALINRIG